IFLIDVETESSFIVSCIWDNTFLVKTRCRQIKSTICITACQTYVVVINGRMLEEIFYIVVDGFIRTESFTPRLSSVIVQCSCIIIETSFVFALLLRQTVDPVVSWFRAKRCFRSSLFPFFSGDDYRSGSSTRTV